MAIEIPKELFMVKRGEERLAFITPHEENAAGRKRKETALSWANGYQSRGIKNDGEVISNELLTGYEILQDVSRWSTDNVVWRILDPRGFEFEIYSGNMSEILRSSSIIKGIIEEKCIFGRENGKNYLIPEASEPYQKAVQFTKAKDNAFGKPSDMRIGDFVTLSNGKEYTYLGKYFVLRYKKEEIGYDNKITFIPSNDAYYFFKPNFEDGDKVYFQKSPKLLSINKGASLENPLGIINVAISTHKLDSIGNMSSYDIVAAMASKKSTFSIEFKDADQSELNVERQYYLPFSYRINGEIFVGSYSYDKAPDFTGHEMEVEGNYFILKNALKDGRYDSYYSSYSSWNQYKVPAWINISRKNITKVEKVYIRIEDQLVPLQNNIY